MIDQPDETFPYDFKGGPLRGPPGRGDRSARPTAALRPVRARTASAPHEFSSEIARARRKITGNRLVDHGIAVTQQATSRLSPIRNHGAVLIPPHDRHIVVGQRSWSGAIDEPRHALTALGVTRYSEDALRVGDGTAVTMTAPSRNSVSHLSSRSRMPIPAPATSRVIADNAPTPSAKKPVRKLPSSRNFCPKPSTDSHIKLRRMTVASHAKSQAPANPNSIRHSTTGNTDTKSVNCTGTRKAAPRYAFRETQSTQL